MAGGAARRALLHTSDRKPQNATKMPPLSETGTEDPLERHEHAFHFFRAPSVRGARGAIEVEGSGQKHSLDLGYEKIPQENKQ